MQRTGEATPSVVPNVTADRHHVADPIKTVLDAVTTELHRNDHPHLVEVEPDVWERSAPIEEDPDRADALARQRGEAAEHTKGATTKDKAIAQVHAKAEEVRAETKIDEKSAGTPADPSKIAADLAEAEKRGGAGELRPLEEKLEEAGLPKSSDDKDKK